MWFFLVQYPRNERKLGCQLAGHVPRRFKLLRPPKISKLRNATRQGSHDPGSLQLIVL